MTSAQAPLQQRFVLVDEVADFYGPAIVLLGETGQRVNVVVDLHSKRLAWITGKEAPLKASKGAAVLVCLANDFGVFHGRERAGEQQ